MFARTSRQQGRCWLIVEVCLVSAAYSLEVAERTSPFAASATDVELTISALSSSALGQFAAGPTGLRRGSTALDVSVESGGSSSIVVGPGSLVEYGVFGLLSDDENEGLALVGFDLDFDGGDLTQADEPTGVPEEDCDDPANYPSPCCDNPMINFAMPWGVTNPSGFGGTVQNGDLIQVGGAQNTIMNTEVNAPFPIGPVLTGVAQPSVCGRARLVTGRLVAPLIDGSYTLSLENLFANVIQEGEDGSGEFWATEPATVGAITNLSIVVTSSGACCVPNAECYTAAEADCTEAGGMFQGEATICGVDADSDGVVDGCDLCLSSPPGIAVGPDGCARPKARRGMIRPE